MKTINNNTKQAARYIDAYNRSEIYYIYQAYEKPNTAKTRADYNYRMMMRSEGGHNYKIIGYNSRSFTVAWIAGKDLRIETARNSFVIPNTVE